MCLQAWVDRRPQYVGDPTMALRSPHTRRNHEFQQCRFCGGHFGSRPGVLAPMAPSWPFVNVCTLVAGATGTWAVVGAECRHQCVLVMVLALTIWLCVSGPDPRAFPCTQRQPRRISTTQQSIRLPGSWTGVERDRQMARHGCSRTARAAGAFTGGPLLQDSWAAGVAALAPAPFVVDDESSPGAVADDRREQARCVLASRVLDSIFTVCDSPQCCMQSGHCGDAAGSSQLLR